MSSSPLILVADDRVDNVEVLQHLLSLEGYQVLGAYDGQEALDGIRQNIPDRLAGLDLQHTMTPK